MRSFAKVKPIRNAKITLSFTDIGKSCPSPKSLTPQICLLKLFAKIFEFTVNVWSDLLFAAERQ